MTIEIAAGDRWISVIMRPALNDAFAVDQEGLPVDFDAPAVAQVAQTMSQWTAEVLVPPASA